MNRLCLGSIGLFFAFALGCGNGSPDSHTSPPPASISISPTTASLLVNQTAQFEAKLQGMSSQDVTWSIEEENGGTITSGLYRAPWTVGTYHVTATAVADTTKTATATISVSAVTAFFQWVRNIPVTWPRSVTPLLGTLHPDGSWDSAPILDPNTIAPVTTELYDIFLSADGTKAVATLEEGTSFDAMTLNIVTFNSDGTGMMRLTNNELSSGTKDFAPQFSMDGQTIAYVHSSSSSIGSELWVMNSDGTNAHSLVSGYDVSASGPTFAPDGSKIAFGYEHYTENGWQNGIAIANTDGSGSPVQLPVVLSNIGVSSYLSPTFTSDGTQIVFVWEVSAGCPGCNPIVPFYSLMIMNADGSNVRNQATSWGLYMPRAMADRILFSDSSDIYSMMPDGSNLTPLTKNNYNVLDLFSFYYH